MLLAILWGDLLWWEYVYCLNLKFCIMWPNLWWSCQKDILEFLSSVEGKPEHLLFLFSKVHIEQCISLYLCSSLSNSTVILLSSRSMLILGVPVCHELPLMLCNSMPLGLQELRILGKHLWHVYKAILFHVWKDQLHALVFFHWTVTLRCICKWIYFFTSVEEPLIYLQTRILVWWFVCQWHLVIQYLFGVWSLQMSSTEPS